MIALQIPIDSYRIYQIFKREADDTTVCVEGVKGLHEACTSRRGLLQQAVSSSPLCPNAEDHRSL